MVGLVRLLPSFLDMGLMTFPFFGPNISTVEHLASCFLQVPPLLDWIVRNPRVFYHDSELYNILFPSPFPLKAYYSATHFGWKVSLYYFPLMERRDELHYSHARFLPFPFNGIERCRVFTPPPSPRSEVIDHVCICSDPLNLPTGTDSCQSFTVRYR